MYCRTPTFLAIDPDLTFMFFDYDLAHKEPQPITCSYGSMIHPIGRTSEKLLRSFSATNTCVIDDQMNKPFSSVTDTVIFPPIFVNLMALSRR